MTARLPSYLKGRFETADIPTETDYTDVFDSFLNLEVSAATQTIKGSVAFNKDVDITGTINVSGAATFGSTIDINGAFSAATINGDIGTFTNRVLETVDSSVAATGTSQASAKSITNKYNVITAVTTAAEEGVVLPGGYPGWEQIIVNNTTASVQIYPPASAAIDSLSAAAPKGLATLSVARVYHITSAQFYMVSTSL